MRSAPLLLLMLCPGPAHAGPWTQASGHTWLQLGTALFMGVEGQSALSDFEAAERVTFEGRAAELYGELGLGAGFEVDLSMRWVDHRHALDGPDRRETGLGDVEALVEYGPRRAGDPLAFRVGARFAPYDTLGLAEAASGRPPLGPGGTDLLLGAGWGHSFDGGWVSLDLLHRLRLEGASAGLNIRAEVGLEFGPLAVALGHELQPAYGRSIDQPEGAPAPVPKAWGLGAKALLDLHAGLGLSAETQWMPETGNDGPGLRLAAGLTFSR